MTFCEMHKSSGGCQECPNRYVCTDSSIKKDSTHVIVGRHINGITLNGYEWLLNEDGSDMIFKDQSEAETFLLKNGFTKDDLETMKFLEVKKNNESFR